MCQIALENLQYCTKSAKSKLAYAYLLFDKKRLKVSFVNIFFKGFQSQCVNKLSLTEVSLSAWARPLEKSEAKKEIVWG